MKAAKYIGKLALVLIGTTALLFVMLVLVWCIPDRYLLEKQQESLELFHQGGDEDEWPFAREKAQWEWIFTHARGAQLDNKTDQTMIANVISESGDAGVLYRAMDCNDYARYWHGYLLFLRPLMLLFSYMQIRYLYMFLYLLLGTAVLLKLNKNFGSATVYVWVFSLCFIYPVVLPFSLQFSSVFFITMAGILAVDQFYQGYAGFDLQKAGILFLVYGVFTSFFDFLTAPLLTLGVPLLYLMLLNYRRYEEESLRENLWTLLITSVTWSAGYLGCWCLKWIIATPVLGRNVIMDGILSVGRRTAMDEGNPIRNGISAVAMNLFAILPPGITGADLLSVCVFLGILILILLILFIKFHKDKENLISLLPFLLVALYPYLWFVAISNHSENHYIFTYRIQLIALLGFLTAYVNSLRIFRFRSK